MASVIVSDTHFGLSNSTLANHRKVDQLMEEISGQENGYDDVVLLGDIFDFWKVRPENAVRDSLYFLKSLYGLDLKIRYILGNHDHHLAVMNQEDEFMERVARGDLYPVYIPALRWNQNIDGLNIEMLYPTYRSRFCHRTFLFTHGHHLGGMQALSMQVVEHLRKLSGEELSPADLEMMMTYAYESIYRSAYIGEMVVFEESLWRASSLLQRFKAGVLKTLRFTPVEGHYDTILKFISNQNLGKVDCFLYGHTHRPGVYQRQGGPLAVNAGSLTREKGKCADLQTPDTYLTLDESGLALRQLGNQEPLFLCEFL